MRPETVPLAWPWLGHVIELAALGLFVWCWAEAQRHDHALRHELVISAVYGWLLETMDMWLFGSYHYGPMTWWWVGHVPLYIPLLWAAILHSSMALSDRTRLPRWARPFLDGLLAVLIDVAIDAIAIRAGLWRWGIGLTEGWFGVPAGNLCAWMWVAAWYGGLTRLVRERSESRGEPRWHSVLIPPFSFAGLFASLLVSGRVGSWIGLNTPNERLWLFAVQVLVFLLIVVYAGSRDRAMPERCCLPMSLIWSRWLMHGSFFLILWTSGIWRRIPVLIAISSVAILIEWWLQRLCGGTHRSPIRTDAQR